MSENQFCTISILLLASWIQISFGCFNYTNCNDKCPHFYDYSTDSIAFLMEQKGGGVAEIKTSFDSALSIINNQTGVITDDRDAIHMTIQYLCCLSPANYFKYIEIVDRLAWEPINITFGKAICNMGGDRIDSANSIVVVLDAASQQRMLAFVERIEAAMVAGGLHIYVPRRAQEPFHTTLAVVDAQYPVADVVEQVNEKVRVWNQSPITIDRFAMFIPPFLFHAK